MDEEFTPPETPGHLPILGLARHAGVGLLGKIGGRALHFVFEVLAARLLGAAQYGLFAVVWNFVRITGLILPLGLDLGVLSLGGQRGESERARLGRLVVSAGTLVLAIGCLGAVGITFLAPELSQWFGKPGTAPLFIGMALSLPAAAVLKVLAAGLRADGRMTTGILVEEVMPYALLSAAGGALYLSLGSLGQIASAVWISFALAALTAGALVWRGALLSYSTIGLAARELAEMFRFALPAALASLFAVLLLLVDRVFVGVLMPDLEVGIYQAISLLTLVFATILSAFKTAVAPRVAVLYEQGDLNGLKSLARWTTRWGYTLSLPFLLMFAVVSKDVLKLLFGSGYVAGSTALIILAVAGVTNVLSGPVEFFLLFTGRRGDWLTLTAMALVLTVGLHLALIPAKGLVGAGISVLLTLAFVSIMAAVRVRQHLGFWVWDWGLLKPTIAGLLTALMLILLAGQSWWGSSLWGLAGFGSLAGLGVLGGVVLLGLEPDDKARLQSVLLRFKETS